MPRFAPLALALSLALLAGCSTQRPLSMVRSDAERHLQYGRYDQAKSDFEYYVEHRPDAVDTRANLARTYLALHEPRKAMEQLQICTDVDPLNDEYLDLQARAMFEAGDRDSLVSTLSRAASERQRPVDYWRLGVYQAKLGNADEAEHALLLAAKIDGGRSVKFQKALADFYGSIGDSEHQLARLRNCLYLTPQDAALQSEIRGLGGVPGPTFAQPPSEQMAGVSNGG